MKDSNYLISIVIPVYNVKKYVSKCLNSVLPQVNEKVEVIVIDDGSTDDSKTICENIIEKSNANIRVLSQNNSGLSATRNRGIDVSTGKYIMFLDSDDELECNAVEQLFESITKYPEVDIFYYDAKTIDEITGGKRRNIYNRKEKIPELTVVDSAEYFSEYYVDTLIASACLCLIRKEILINNCIKFDEGRLYEDNVFSLNVLLSSKKVCYLPYDLYIRRYREDSITTTRIKEKNIIDICFVLKRFLGFKQSIFDMGSKIACNSYITLIYKIYNWGHNMMMNADMNLSCMETISGDIEEMLIQWPEEYKCCSYYLFRNLLLKTEPTLEGDVKRKIRDCYSLLFEQIKSYENQRIAIYGRGKHTQILLEEYSEIMGEELKFLVYADSYQKGGIELDGKIIVNIADVEQYADVIVISSYCYRLEMLKKCRDLKLDVKILDLYDVEKMNMFDERLVF